MLVLNRRVGEEIVIGGQIRIRIVEVTKRSVRIGIVAPRCVPVHREEIYQRLKRIGDDAERGTTAQTIENEAC